MYKRFQFAETDFLRIFIKNNKQFQLVCFSRCFLANHFKLYMAMILLWAWAEFLGADVLNGPSTQPLDIRKKYAALTKR
jgi:hypothetical protein